MASDHRLRRIVAGSVVVIVVIGGFLYWYQFIRKDQRPVNVAQVEHSFSGGRGAAGDPRTGVYQYATTGKESVSALTGQTNTYPATTTLTVSATPCGVTTVWNVLTGRSDTNRRCRLPSGAWTLVGTSVSDRFFNTTQVDTSRCTMVELTPNPAPHTTTHGRCRTGENFVDLEYEVIGFESLRIGRTMVPTVHLHITSTQGGRRRGGGTEDRWVQPGTNLVVKSRSTESDISPSPVGEVTYKQDYTLVLKSMTPHA